MADLMVTPDGKVFLNGQEKPYTKTGNGKYYTVKHRNVRYWVHRLVAEKYLPNPLNLPEINHKDGDKYNNAVANLEWTSHKDNILHALRTGLHPNPELSVIGTCKVTGAEQTFVSEAEAARQTPAKQSNISKCLAGLRKSAGGFYWRHAFG